MTAILGISAFYHDSAAALVVDGEIVAAAQEERFTRQKHDQRFPVQSIEYCLSEAGLKPAELDWVGFYDKPLLKFERLLETYLAYAPVGFSSFARAMPLWLREKLHLRWAICDGLRGEYRRRVVFVEHHESHAASAFFPSPFDEAAILTLDGVGEWATASCGHGRDNRIELTRQLRFPHSLGLLYSAFTYYTGFEVNRGEYKVMGLAPYGTPRYASLIYEQLMDLKDDGSFRLDMSYFNYCQGLTMTSPKFHRLFGGPPREPESPITQRDMDLAASVQSVTEEVMLRAARHVHRATGSRNLVLAGGVALNCVGNGRILREGPFDNVWIQPAAGDAGGALGVAQFIHYQLLDNSRTVSSCDSQRGSLLGPCFGAEKIERFLHAAGAKYEHMPDEDALCDEVARLLAEEKVVGWLSGRMEFGPRALGARSILGDARGTSMQSRINSKIKSRESFRPFAPSVLRDRVSEYFEMRICQDSPYMLLVAPLREDKRLDTAQAEDGLEGIERLQVPRSVVPAVTHVDDSARVQTVDDKRHPRYHKLLKAFERKTGCPMLVNTSFNVRDEPIVCTPEEAYRCFLSSDMDVLVLEDFVLNKKDQEPLGPNAPGLDRKPASKTNPAGHLPNLKPSDKTLKGFAAIGMFMLGLVVAPWMFYRGHTTTAIIFWAMAIALRGLAWANPRWVRWPFVVLSVVTWPIGVVVSHLVLAFVYYLIFTPVALVFRLMGRDALARSFERGAPTYWESPNPDQGAARYFKQF